MKCETCKYLTFFFDCETMKENMCCSKERWLKLPEDKEDFASFKKRYNRCKLYKSTEIDLEFVLEYGIDNGFSTVYKSR